MVDGLLPIIPTFGHLEVPPSPRWRAADLRERSLREKYNLVILLTEVESRSSFYVAVLLDRFVG